MNVLVRVSRREKEAGGGSGSGSGSGSGILLVEVFRRELIFETIMIEGLDDDDLPSTHIVITLIKSSPLGR